MSSLTVPDTTTCMETFDVIDFNRVGLLSTTELEQAVIRVWPHHDYTKSAIMRAYKACDVNRDGFIGRNEFELFLTFLALHNNLWVAQANGGGCNNNNNLTKQEFIKAASQLNIVVEEETFDEIDVHGNGFVIYDDFVSWMARHTLDRKTSKGGSFRFANSGSTQAFEASRSNTEGGGATYLARLILNLRCSLDFLNGTVSDDELEAWAILIHEVMSNTQHRSLHGMDLMFEIWKGADPIQTLAICFTHVVFHVSDGQQIHPKVKELLKGVMDETDGFVISQKIKKEQDPPVAMVMSIFGVAPGECLDPYLLDKFLSAIVAVRLLKDSLPMVQLTKVVVCIEATITYFDDGGSTDAKAFWKVPTHKPLHRRETSFLEEKAGWLLDRIHAEALKSRRTLDSLFDRLLETNEEFQLGLNQHKAVKAVQRAADVSNRFRGSVFVTDTESHLSKVWALLPEFNPALRQPKLYTVRDYHLAIKNLERLICFVSEHQVFVSFRGVPDAQEVATFTRSFERNVEMGKLYIRTKAVSCSIVAAFANLTGGDVPVCFITGDPGTFHACLPKVSPDRLEKCNKDLYHVLCNRSMTPDISFDITNWVVTAFVYGMLGDHGIMQALQYTSYPMTDERARALLSTLPLDVVLPLGEMISRTAVSRTDAVKQLLEELKK